MKGIKYLNLSLQPLILSARSRSKEMAISLFLERCVAIQDDRCTVVFLCGKKQLIQRAGENSTPNNSGDYILENSFPVSTKKQKTKYEVASRTLKTFRRMFHDTVRFLSFRSKNSLG